MTTVTNAVHQIITPDELALLPDGAMAVAVMDTLKKYSLQNPLIKIEDVSVVVGDSDVGYSQLPEFWTAGFSKIKQIELNPDNVQVPTDPPVLLGGSGQIDIYHDGALVVENAERINFTGTDAHVTGADTQANVIIPAPSFSITSLTIAPSSIEKGQQLDSVQVSWNLSSQPTEQRLNDAPLSVDSRNHNVTTVPADLTFTLTATSNFGDDTKTKTITVLNRILYGRGGASITVEQAEAFTDKLQTGYAGHYSFADIGNDDALAYPYILIPSDMVTQEVIFMSGQFNAPFNQTQTLQITNGHALTQAYLVYRNVDKAKGGFVISVS